MPGPMVLSCPSCGASIAFSEGDTEITCQFCGSTVVIPVEMRGAAPQPTPTAPPYSPEPAPDMPELGAQVELPADQMVRRARQTTRVTAILPAIVAAALAMCGAGVAAFYLIGSSDNSGSSGAPPTGTPSSREVLFSDDFSDNSSGWGEDTGQHYTERYLDGELVITVDRDQWHVWVTPGQKNLSDIHIEVTLRSTGAAPDAAFGVVCDYRNDNNYYELGFGADSYYAITRHLKGDEQVLSDSSGNWVRSSAIRKDRSSYRLGADCGNGTLALYVDGKLVDSVDDDSLSAGDVGLFVLTFDNPDAEVHFDDYEVTTLQ